jgi:hypothetical protein
MLGDHDRLPEGRVVATKVSGYPTCGDDRDRVAVVRVIGLRVKGHGETHRSVGAEPGEHILVVRCAYHPDGHGRAVLGLPPSR